MKLSLTQVTSLVNHIAIHRNESAYEKLFIFLFPSLKRFCFSLLKSHELAEEVAGDVMIALWQKEQQLLKIDNVKVYAFVAAKNISLNILKKNLRQKIISLNDIHIDIALDDATPEQILITDELRKNLEIAIQSLPPRCKLVFQLIKEENMSYKEVAEILNISIKTVDAHLVAAMKKLMYAVKNEFNLA